LSDEPVIRSGREQTYTPGKDTGRYWDAGASNVHWVIVTDQQVEQGIKQALERVRAPGVFIEGTSLLKYIEVDLALMAARPEGGKIKPSARRALPRTSAIYLFDDDTTDPPHALERFSAWAKSARDVDLLKRLPLYTSKDLPHLIAELRALPKPA
jgi:hypothetical protein